VTKAIHFALVPRDGLFCKDGRGWHTSASGRGHALQWPWPSTVLGAVRTAWGRLAEREYGVAFGPVEWRQRTSSIRLGRTLVLRRPHGTTWSREHRVWPVPADALWLKGETHVYRLDPIRGTIRTIGRDDDEAREALWWPLLDRPEKPLPAPRWWSDEDVCRWLAGHAVSVHDGPAPLLPSRRIQVHVSVRSEEQTADEGALFSHDVVETLEHEAEWAIGVEADVPVGRLPRMATLGSDSRLARIEEIPSEMFEPPDGLLDAFRPGSAGLRLLVNTPACFRRGWLPDGLERRGEGYRGRLAGIGGEVVLRAAFVPRPIHVSGWDIAANNGKGAPKPTARMVAPGSVYFFQRTDGTLFDDAAARALWMAAIGDRTDEGFGRVVPGVWSPRRGTG
jgi:CRISPR-associated protein Cmr3